MRIVAGKKFSRWLTDRLSSGESLRGHVVRRNLDEKGAPCDLYSTYAPPDGLALYDDMNDAYEPIMRNELEVPRGRQ